MAGDPVDGAGGHGDGAEVIIAVQLQGAVVKRDGLAVIAFTEAVGHGEFGRAAVGDHERAGPDAAVAIPAAAGGQQVAAVHGDGAGVGIPAGQGQGAGAGEAEAAATEGRADVGVGIDGDDGVIGQHQEQIGRAAGEVETAAVVGIKQDGRGRDVIGLDDVAVRARARAENRQAAINPVHIIEAVPPGGGAAAPVPAAVLPVAGTGGIPPERPAGAGGGHGVGDTDRGVPVSVGGDDGITVGRVRRQPEIEPVGRAHIGDDGAVAEEFIAEGIGDRRPGDADQVAGEGHRTDSRRGGRHRVDVHKRRGGDHVAAGIVGDLRVEGVFARGHIGPRIRIRGGGRLVQLRRAVIELHAGDAVAVGRHGGREIDGGGRAVTGPAGGRGQGHQHGRGGSGGRYQTLDGGGGKGVGEDGHAADLAVEVRAVAALVIADVCADAGAKGLFRAKPAGPQLPVHVDIAVGALAHAGHAMPVAVIHRLRAGQLELVGAVIDEESGVAGAVDGQLVFAHIAAAGTVTLLDDHAAGGGGGFDPALHGEIDGTVQRRRGAQEHPAVAVELGGDIRHRKAVERRRLRPGHAEHAVGVGAIPRAVGVIGGRAGGLVQRPVSIRRVGKQGGGIGAQAGRLVQHGQRGGAAAGAVGVAHGHGILPGGGRLEVGEREGAVGRAGDVGAVELPLIIQRRIAGGNGRQRGRLAGEIGGRAGRDVDAGRAEDGSGDAHVVEGAPVDVREQRLVGIQEHAGIDGGRSVIGQGDDVFLRPVGAIVGGVTGEVGQAAAHHFEPGVTAQIGGPGIGIAIAVAHGVVFIVSAAAHGGEHGREAGAGAVAERLADGGIGGAAQDDARAPGALGIDAVRGGDIGGHGPEMRRYRAVAADGLAQQVHAVPEQLEGSVRLIGPARVIMHLQRRPIPRAERRVRGDDAHRGGIDGVRAVINEAGPHEIRGRGPEHRIQRIRGVRNGAEAIVRAGVGPEVVGGVFREVKLDAVDGVAIGGDAGAEAGVHIGHHGAVGGAGDGDGRFAHPRGAAEHGGRDVLRTDARALPGEAEAVRVGGGGAGVGRAHEKLEIEGVRPRRQRHAPALELRAIMQAVEVDDVGAVDGQRAAVAGMQGEGVQAGGRHSDETVEIEAVVGPLQARGQVGNAHRPGERGGLRAEIRQLGPGRGVVLVVLIRQSAHRAGGIGGRRGGRGHGGDGDGGIGVEENVRDGERHIGGDTRRYREQDLPRLRVVVDHGGHHRARVGDIGVHLHLIRKLRGTDEGHLPLDQQLGVHQPGGGVGDEDGVKRGNGSLVAHDERDGIAGRDIVSIRVGGAAGGFRAGVRGDEIDIAMGGVLDLVGHGPGAVGVEVAAGVVDDVVAGIAAADVFLPAGQTLDAGDGEGILERGDVIPVAADRFLDPHALITDMGGAVGGLPVAGGLAGPEIGGELRPVAFNEATAALGDLRVPGHVGAAEVRDLLEPGLRIAAAGGPADVLDEGVGGAVDEVLVGETAVEVTAAAVGTADIVLMDGIIDPRRNIGGPVVLADAIRAAGDVEVIILGAGGGQQHGQQQEGEATGPGGGLGVAMVHTWTVNMGLKQV